MIQDPPGGFHQRVLARARTPAPAIVTRMRGNRVAGSGERGELERGTIHVRRHTLRSRMKKTKNPDALWAGGFVTSSP